MKLETRYRISVETDDMGRKKFRPQKKLWWWIWRDMSILFFLCEADARKYIEKSLRISKAQSSATIEYLPYP